MLRLKRVSKLLILFLLFYTIAYADKIKVNKVSDATGGGISANNTAYGAGWNGSTTEVPSQNVLWDKIETLAGGHNATTVTDSASIDFTITEQDLTGVVLPAGVDHNSLANYSITRHFLETEINMTNMAVGILSLARGGTGAANLDNLIALTTNTTGNYVASVATTAPLTGGAAGSEGAALTIVIPKATAAADGYLNMTDWSTFNNKLNITATGGSLTAVNAANLTNLLGDLATTGPITGAANDIFPGANGVKATIAINQSSATVDGYLSAINWTTFNNSIDTEVDPTVDTSAEILAIIGANAITGTQVNENTLSIKNKTLSFCVYNSTADVDPGMGRWAKASTITRIDIQTYGTANQTFAIEKAAQPADGNLSNLSWSVMLNSTLYNANTWVNYTAFNNATIAVGSIVQANISASNGNPKSVVTMLYDED